MRKLIDEMNIYTAADNETESIDYHPYTEEWKDNKEEENATD